MDTNRVFATAASRGLLLLLAVCLVTCGLLPPCRAQDSNPGNVVSPGLGFIRRRSVPPPDGPIPLYFIFLSATSLSINTSGSIPAVNHALEMVDKAGFLAPYKLQYSSALDSRVSTQLSIVILTGVLNYLVPFYTYVRFYILSNFSNVPMNKLHCNKPL